MQAWWYTLGGIIPVLGRLRQEQLKFEAKNKRQLFHLTKW